MVLLTEDSVTTGTFWKELFLQHLDQKASFTKYIYIRLKSPKQEMEWSDKEMYLSEWGMELHKYQMKSNQQLAYFKLEIFLYKKRFLYLVQNKSWNTGCYFSI